MFKVAIDIIMLYSTNIYSDYVMIHPLGTSAYKHTTSMTKNMNLQLAISERLHKQVVFRLELCIVRAWLHNKHWHPRGPLTVLQFNTQDPTN